MSRHLFHPDFKPEPYWWEAARPTVDGSQDLPEATEVLVVGSGYAGLACALELQRGGKTATDPRGADTIFLLSDGAPSNRAGDRLLAGDALEGEIKKFLDANRPFRGVVHTIGVGPEHNRGLLQRLARETGGTYKAVGVD